MPNRHSEPQLSEADISIIRPAHAVNTESSE